jgi:hypothetical protein
MIKYQYQLIKYVHDQFTGEFVNVGVIVYSPENLFLQSKVLNSYSRIIGLFPGANGIFINRLLRNFDSEISRISKSLKELFKPSPDLSSITNNILPKDDSALQISDVKFALDLDLNAAISDLFKDFVEKYIIHSNATNTLTDEEVWRKNYKTYFDRYQISERLTSHNVATSNDQFTFDHAWKNEIWHCYQPISFALQNKESIKDKVYKWVGKIQEINNSKEKIHLTFLSAIAHDHKALKDFIVSQLDKDTEHVQIDVVMESEAETIAKQIQELMLEHDEQ